MSSAAGKIINISSVHQHIPWAGHVNYAASKGGLALLTSSMAQELAARCIRVNAIAPGAIRTDINGAAWQTPTARARLLDLASDASDYVTGATLVVDGGMSLYPAFRDNG